MIFAKILHSEIPGNIKKALELTLDFIKTFTSGKSEYCYLSYEPENIVAKKLYQEFGFVENGEMDEEEVIAVLKL